MSIQIPTWFRIKYHDDVTVLAQQMTSRLEMAVRRDPDNLQGKFGYFDRIGVTEVAEVTTRHGDHDFMTTPHSRRRITLKDYYWSDLVDKRDMRRFAQSGSLPSRYSTIAVAAHNRKKDDRIIAAARGNAYAIDEDDAATTVALPSSQKVAASSTGLTLAKLLSAKEILDGAEVEDDGRFVAYTSQQGTDLLNTTEIKNADYNTVKALVEGQINSFLGFNFIRTERLPLISTGVRACLAWQQRGIGVAFGQEIMTDISVRNDKHNSVQVYVDMSMDATRIEDERVVEIAANES